MDELLKPIYWVGSSLDDLKKLPNFVRREFGFALHQAQEGVMPKNAKFLTGLGAGIIEIMSDYQKNT